MKIRHLVLGAFLLMPCTSAIAAGAIAVDDERGQSARDAGYGLGWGDTREEAAREALKECRDSGNTNCRVVARFDTCGAYAASRTTYGVGWGRTEEAAKGMALANCPNCRIVISDCE